MPDASKICEEWLRTIEQIERRDLSILSRHLDWVAKRALLNTVKDGDLRKALDLRFAEVDNGAIARFLYGEGGMEAIESILPGKTRTSPLTMVPRERARAEILRRYPGLVADVDWDYVLLRDRDDRDWFLSLDDPVDSRRVLQTVQNSRDEFSLMRGLRKLPAVQEASTSHLIAVSVYRTSGKEIAEP